ncbi:Rpp14/Pop5 family protein [Candidatus Bathyarchaeota archaeon]|nr:Rpp14/Pop5 family protein [Candidatus Bathyarchaeota archaeon]
MTMYVRRRYIAVKVDGNKEFNGKEVFNAVWNSLTRLFGEHGASLAELSLIEYNQEKRQAIFRCSHKALDMVKASITAVTEVSNEKACLHVARVSGTLKSLRTRTASLK